MIQFALTQVDLARIQFLAMRTDGSLADRAGAAARRLALPVAAAAAALLAWTVAVAVDSNDKDVFPPVLPAALGAAALLLALVLVLGRRTGWAFLAIGGTDLRDLDPDALRGGRPDRPAGRLPVRCLGP